MPVARYFLFVGGMLLALLFALDAFAPQQMVVAGNAAPSINKTVVRIRSDQKLPERVVYDTSLPTIVPPAAATQIAAARRPRTSAPRRRCATPLPSSSRPRPRSLKSSLSRKPRASARSPRSVRLSRCALPSNRTLDSASSEAIPGKPSRIAREHLDSVCPRASDRRSAGIVFRGNDLRVSLPPPVGAGRAPHPARRQSRE